MQGMLKKYLYALLGLSCIVLILPVFAVVPSFVHHDTRLQISTLQQGAALPDGFYVYQCLNAEGIQIKSITPEDNAMVIRFASWEESVAAQRVLHELLPDVFIIAQAEPGIRGAWLNKLSFKTELPG